MIEKTALDYLSEHMAEPCSAEIPETRPESFVVVDKTNGSLTEHLGETSLAIQSYAPSKYAAAQLNERVIAIMLGITELSDVSRCELNSDYPFPELSGKSYRYQAVFDLTHYDVPN